MKIVLLSFYYPPDLCAGSFRAGALVNALLELLPEDAHLDVITTLPNRYNSFTQTAPELEQSSRLTVRRIKLPNHKSGMIDQTKAFIAFAYHALSILSKNDYNLVCATSSRLMTAALGALVARNKKIPLYLDIRDIFVDTIKDVLPGKKARLVAPFFSLLERWTITQARKINLVSEGFKDYFQGRYPDQCYSYFTNGIDPEFMESSNTGTVADPTSRPLTVLYAGNIGEGQSLHTIIPELAKRFEGRITFRVIGDGGRKNLLQQRLLALSCHNVELLPPMKREQLLREYQKADILFLHLGDYDAFKKVLPSKIFEYAAMGKPIWAGVSGYAATFIAQEIDNAAVFHPADANAAEQAFDTLVLGNQQRGDFMAKYSRITIMRNMAADIIGLV
ncbi:Glycosyl transferase, group 1 [Crenothrix polyspora]|uniref:Glycosyl transferase, group 1 n=1 Tax=Crenothrix polyspora TaxID=360316 RepID=A0A1R4HAQ7_9GAMM|nr:glycosyltransferase family 4 protein [Crenothrix polyspora]SJM93111.1 Glycosyl transferase, group 1 [Crenothrix polyspora]